MKGTILFLMFVGLVVGLLYGMSDSFVEKDHAYITHTYTLSNGTELLINNWNCGEGCPARTTVYRRKYYYKNFNISQVVFSCDYVSDIELSDITELSAKIEKLTTTTEDTDLICPYHQGNRFYF